jgi:hypothetical protein
MPPGGLSPAGDRRFTCRADPAADDGLAAILLRHRRATGARFGSTGWASGRLFADSESIGLGERIAKGEAYVW